MRTTFIAAGLAAVTLAGAGPAAAEPMSVTIKNSADRLFTVSGPWNIAPLLSGSMNTVVVENSSVTYTIAFNTSPWSMVCAVTLNHAFAAGVSTCTQSIQLGGTPFTCSAPIMGSGTAQCTATVEVSK